MSASNDYSREPGTLLILAGYYGLGALIQATLNGIWLADQLGKTPVIWWGKHCFYRTADGSDAYEKLFVVRTKPILREQVLAPSGAAVYPALWQEARHPLSVAGLEAQIDEDKKFSMLNWKKEAREQIIRADLCVLNCFLTPDLAWELAGRSLQNYSEDRFNTEACGMFRAHFEPVQEVKDATEKLWSGTFPKGVAVVGTHLRGSDKITDGAIPNPKTLVKRARKMGRQLDTRNFFLATDSDRGMRIFKENIGQMNRFLAQSFTRAAGAEGLHFTTKNGVQQARETIMDVECLARCSGVVAFPWSLMYWWLMRLRETRGLTFPVAAIKPSPLDYLITLRRLSIHKNPHIVMDFLRQQKNKIRKKLRGEWYVK